MRRLPMILRWRLLLAGVSAGLITTPAVATARTTAPITSIARQASIAVNDTVLVAARELPRGTVLRAGDVDTLVTDSDAAVSQPALPTASHGETPAEGWVVRRLVHKGEPLRPPAVAPPALVDAGDPVTLVWDVGGLRVTRAGTAVGPAFAGESVVVRVDAKRRFIGIATAPGTVVVSQP